MAQTLKFGNKTWATKVGSTLAYNDENGNYKPLPFNFTRSTSATRVNKEGLIEVVTNDRPRIDYTDTSDGVLLLEKAATNSLFYSNDFSNVYWSKLNTTINLNTSTSPDGTTNASLIYPTTSGTDRLLEKTLSATTGQVWTSSFFVKASGFDWVLIYAPNLGTCWFNATTGVFGNVNSSVTARVLGQVNGFWRISLTGTLNSSGVYFYAGVADLNGTTFATTSGTNGIYIFGAMLEQNSVASSYIPTQGSASTRVAETASGSGNSEVFNDSEGVLFVDTAALSDDGTSRRISVSDGSSNPNNLVCLDMSEYTNTIIGRIRTSNSEVAFLQSTSQKQTQKNKIAVKYKVNDFALWINGFEVDTDNNGAVPIGLNDISFDRGNGSNDYYGKTKEIGYYNTILTDLELETLTSYKSWTSMVNELNLNIIYNG